MSKTARMSLLAPPVRPPTSRQRRMFRDQARTDDVFRALYPDDLPNEHFIQHPVDVTKLDNEGRKRLLAGPKVSVVAYGNNVIRNGVPIRALMASSTKLYSLLNAKSLVTEFSISDRVDTKCVERLLDSFTTQEGLNASTIKLTSRNFFNDILMYQACLAIGIHPNHVVPLRNALLAEITRRLLTFDEMNAIIDCVPVTDPLFKHLTLSLCNRRQEKRISNIATFEEWLGRDSKKALQTAMMEIDLEEKRRLNVHKARQAAVIERILGKTKAWEAKQD